MRPLYSLLPAIAFFMVATHALSQSFDTGMEAVHEGDYTSAYEEFHTLAVEGNADAQFHLAWLYLSGKGISQDSDEAEKWFRYAADQGHTIAQFIVGDRQVCMLTFVC